MIRRIVPGASRLFTTERSCMNDRMPCHAPPIPPTPPSMLIRETPPVALPCTACATGVHIPTDDPTPRLAAEAAVDRRGRPDHGNLAESSSPLRREPHRPRLAAAVDQIRAGIGKPLVNQTRRFQTQDFAAPAPVVLRTRTDIARTGRADRAEPGGRLHREPRLGSACFGGCTISPPKLPSSRRSGLTGPAASCAAASPQLSPGFGQDAVDEAVRPSGLFG